MRHVLGRRAAGCLAAAVTVLMTAIGTPAPAAAPADPVPADPARVRAFLDARVPQLLAEQHIPGAAVAVVSGGDEVFAGGYGYADLEDSRPVGADTTAFRTASIGKSFTAAAVLQLVEAGELDLSTDVNTYLPESIHIPDTYPGQPVTLHHLLTHTAGFAGMAQGQVAASASDVLPLEEHLARHRPDRVDPPGRFVSYSNYGFDLAGYIVQEVSGQPFGSYLDEQLFRPLGMEHTGYIAPAEAPEQFDVPSHYRYTEEEGYTTFPLVHPQGGPSGATINATASDLGRFLRALLAGGAVDGRQVLRPDTVATMLSRHAGNHPALTGSGYGVWQLTGDGPHVFTNYGGDAGAHNQYALVPELDLGIYVATNGDGTVDNFMRHARALIVEEFLARFAGTRPYPVPDGEPSGLDKFAGTYHTTRRPNGEPVQLFQSLFDRVTVTAPGDGTLVTEHPMLPAGPWQQGPDGVFVSTDGTDRLGFIEEDGEIAGLAFDSHPSNAYERTPWYDTPALAAAGVALLILLTVVAWPVAAAVRRWRRRPAPGGGRRASVARLLAAAVALTGVGYVGFLGYGAADPLVFETGSQLQTVPLALAAPVALAAAVGAVLGWRRGWWSAAGRIHYSAVAVAGVVFIGVAALYGQVWTP